jgi:hypothetical protein
MNKTSSAKSRSKSPTPKRPRRQKLARAIAPRQTRFFRLVLPLKGFNDLQVQSISPLKEGLNIEATIRCLVPIEPFAVFFDWQRSGRAVDGEVQIFDPRGQTIETIELKGIRPLFVQTPELNRAVTETWIEQVQVMIGAVARKVPIESTVASLLDLQKDIKRAGAR